MGPKTPREHRHMHLHLLGRSRTSPRASWRWGESPRFPDFAERHTWAAGFQPLSAEECTTIVRHTKAVLTTRYGVAAAEIAPWLRCLGCGYPTPHAGGESCAACAVPSRP